ncbi:molybdopterin synthase subunit MoaE [Andreprevotia lacus DSM 23236]|jgi:molybdopterin synthase catalytic subunit|uniref:Molybdopterin synthase catalytic subunit n=1 Tax=Andreprevotia lacus DSM 23236 TaxID=1121001 RepID=A0A1W1XHK6_9NEIS|nr:molybdenum cofactor biosynthesis protein MoaE [Andreprevotia lacus]SMC22991.1 molybdopterin synthase subunit MoaE [Andreprevotia lacus DSM 23236]
MQREPSIRIVVQAEDFDPGQEEALLHDGDLHIGGSAAFVGRVRADGDDLLALTLEHYPGMTEKSLQALAEQAAERWQLSGVTVIHRIGRLLPGERIVLVLTASAHRQAALTACEFLIDALKTDAPFWKCEERTRGKHWVEAKAGDNNARQRWANHE